MNDAADEDDGHHRALQVAVLKEELLGDKGYEDIHCQVDPDEDDYVDYADDVNGEDDDGADYVSQEKDLACQELLCPLGWQWSSQREECSLKKGAPASRFFSPPYHRTSPSQPPGFSCCPPRYHLCERPAHEWCQTSNSTTSKSGSDHF